MTKPTAYMDMDGETVAVIHGLGDKWISARGRHRMKSPKLPPRDTREEAQTDLDAYAKAKKWTPMPDEPEYIKEVAVAETSTETALTVKEQKALQTQEAVIAKGMHTFVEVGNALLAIRDGRLYRERYRTFEVYCSERWEMSKPQATRLICSARVIENLVPIGTVLPATESQARPLTTIPMEQVGDVWQEVIETAPKNDDGEPIITAKHVDETVKRWKEADDSYQEDANSDGGFDFESESIKVFDWVRKRAQNWPDDYRQALGKILKQLANEVI